MKNTTKGFTIVELLVVMVILLVVIGGVFGGASKLFFGRTYDGVITSCEKLEAAFAEGSKIFSFSVEIETENEILNFSSEDRQFASVKKDDKVKVKVFQYPPWNIMKSGTYYGGRLLKKYK